MALRSFASMPMWMPAAAAAADFFFAKAMLQVTGDGASVPTPAG
jgi:hypothetical protein